MSRPTLVWPLLRTLAQRPVQPAAHAHHVGAFALEDELPHRFLAVIASTLQSVPRFHPADLTLGIPLYFRRRRLRWRPAGFEELRILLLALLWESVDVKALRQPTFNGSVVEPQGNEAALTSNHSRALW
jgi:hypothetical protein